MRTEPAREPACEAVPEPKLDAASVLARFDGDTAAALNAALSDIRYLRKELSFATLAMSYGFARGWSPSVSRGQRDGN